MVDSRDLKLLLTVASTPASSNAGRCGVRHRPRSWPAA